MKITVNLTAAEVKGIKNYLASLEGEKEVKIGKAQITEEIQGIVNGNLQTGAMWDYIRDQMQP